MQTRFGKMMMIIVKENNILTSPLFFAGGSIVSIIVSKTNFQIEPVTVNFKGKQR